MNFRAGNQPGLRSGGPAADGMRDGEVDRRHALTALAAFGAMVCAAPACAADEAATIVVSAPGPSKISCPPVDLIPAIGADRAEGAGLRILHGGAVAPNKRVSGNADFAVAGLPAAMSLRAWRRGGRADRRRAAVRADGAQGAGSSLGVAERIDDRWVGRRP